MLIITGTIAYDYIMDFPEKFSDHILPEQIHNINLSFIVNNFSKRRGGTAGNVSYSLGLLKTDQILFSVAGKDFEEYKKTFTKLGINTKHVLVDKKEYTATGFAMTDATNNQIWGYFYGAAGRIPELELRNVLGKIHPNPPPLSSRRAPSSAPFLKEGTKPETPPLLKGDGGILVLIGPGGAAGSMSFVKQCIELGIDYMFDPGFILTQVSDSDLTLGVKHAKYIIGNEYELHLIKSRIKKFAEVIKGKTIITTLGEKGAMIEEGNQTIIIQSAVPDKVLDPTGAGDAWRSGFLAGLARGFDLQTSGQMGALTAVYCVEQYGPQEHTFTLKQFEKRYRQNYNTLIKL
jgi:adenosine kinase